MPRPKGFDYTIPDPIKKRCEVCNSDGMNRTGLKPIGFLGTHTTSLYSVECPGECVSGLKPNQQVVRKEIS